MDILEDANNDRIIADKMIIKNRANEDRKDEV